MENLPHSNTAQQWACLADPRPIYVDSTNKELQITRPSFNISNHGDIVGMYVFLLELNFVHVLGRN